MRLVPFWLGNICHPVLPGARAVAVVGNDKKEIRRAGEPGRPADHRNELRQFLEMSSLGLCDAQSPEPCGGSALSLELTVRSENLLRPRTPNTNCPRFIAKTKISMTVPMGDDILIRCRSEWGRDIRCWTAGIAAGRWEYSMPTNWRSTPTPNASPGSEGSRLQEQICNL